MRSCDAIMSCSLSGEELAIDTLNCEFSYEVSSGAAKSEDGAALTSIPYATPLWYYSDENYIGKFFVKSVKRVSRDTYSLAAVSAIGVLDSHTYYGRLLENVPLDEAVRDILLTDGLKENSTPFMQELAETLEYGPDVAELLVSGLIPVCSKRQALHYIFFANNLTLRKGSDDSMVIT